MGKTKDPDLGCSGTDRFIDRGERIYDLGEEILVVCPKCAGMAMVIIISDVPAKLNDRLFAPRRLVCTKCLHRDSWSGRQVSVGGPSDWYFGLPLWLTAPCCGEVFWAYDLEHLEIIESYVAAKLRERTNKGRNSFLSKLPKWLKSAKNRDEILRTIGKLKGKLDAGT